MSTLEKLAVSCCVAVLATKAHAVPHILSDDEMAAVLGGVVVTRWDYPAFRAVEYVDNPKMHFQIENEFKTDRVFIRLMAGDEKAHGDYVSTESTLPNGNKAGEFKSRLNFRPFGGTELIDVEYCPLNDQGTPIISQCSMAGGDNQAYQAISPALKVTGVWFHELRATNNPENRTDFVPSVFELIDNLSYLYSHTEPTSADAIMEQCSAQKRWQFRHYKQDVLDVPEERLNVNNNQETRRYFKSLADRSDPNNEYYHVFWVNSIEGAAYGFAPNRQNYTVMVDYSPLSWTIGTLVHQFGHSQNLPHVDEGAWLDIDWSYLNDCSQTIQQKNLMCGNGHGLELHPNQCNYLFENRAALLDLN